MKAVITENPHGLLRNKFNRLKWRSTGSETVISARTEEDDSGSEWIVLRGPCGDTCKLPIAIINEPEKFTTKFEQATIYRLYNAPGQREKALEMISILLIKWAMKECMLCTPLEELVHEQGHESWTATR